MIAGANSTSNQAWADVIEGTNEDEDVLVGTPEADIIDSKVGTDLNIGDAIYDEGSGKLLWSSLFHAYDIIDRGKGDDYNLEILTKDRILEMT